MIVRYYCILANVCRLLSHSLRAELQNKYRLFLLWGRLIYMKIEPLPAPQKLGNCLYKTFHKLKGLGSLFSCNRVNYDTEQLCKGKASLTNEIINVEQTFRVNVIICCKEIFCLLRIYTVYSTITHILQFPNVLILILKHEKISLQEITILIFIPLWFSNIEIIHRKIGKRDKKNQK